MIIDSHAYCFEPGDSPAGHASGQEHLRWLQAAHAWHHQPAWRVGDRAPGFSTVLDPQGHYAAHRLPDVRFRMDRERGRFLWTADGHDYTKQFYPLNLEDMGFTPHRLVAEMDYAGVDVALLHTNPMLGRDIDFQAACVRMYPDRLRSMAPLDEWRIAGETDAVIGEVTEAVETHGLHAVKFNTGLPYLSGTEPWDAGSFRPFWEAVVALRVPIFFTHGAGPARLAVAASVGERRQAYLDELAVLVRWMERYPDAVCSITHGLPWRLFLEGDRIVLPETVWAPFGNPNCHLEVCFPVRIGDLFDFPYREVWPTVAEMVDRIGADRLMWGTDMPFQNRFCTYRQSRAWIEKYCDFLTPEDRGMILGGTVARVLGIS